MKLLVVIVNYRTADLTIEAVQAAMPQLQGLDPEGGQMAIHIVDNESGDGSYEKLRAAVEEHGWQERVQVIASPKNGGFAYGNNVAIRPALEWEQPPELFYLLNPDAVPDPGCIATLLSFMEGHPDCGIAGSRVHGGDGKARPTAFRFPSVASELESGLRLGLVTRLLSDRIIAPPPPAQATQVQWLSGASLMIRRELFETVGVFDDTFFLYFEETDLCLRSHRAGWKNYYVPEAGVMHIGSVATGLGDKKKRRPGYWFDSRMHYFRKNHGLGYLLAANATWATAFAAWRVRRRLQRRPDEDPEHLLSDFLRHSLAAVARG